LIENHGGLLLVEEYPNGINSLEVVSRDFVELAFRGIQFLFVLGAHYFEVELLKSLYLRHLLNRKGT